MTVKNLVIDDLRNLFEDRDLLLSGRDPVNIYARNSLEGVNTLLSLKSHGVENLWLDHDLGIVPVENTIQETIKTSSFGSVESEATLSKGTLVKDTIMPVVNKLVSLSEEGDPYPVANVYIHTSNRVGGINMLNRLRGAGYHAIMVDSEDFLEVHVDE